MSCRVWRSVSWLTAGLVLLLATSASGLELEEARHLLGRAGFGGHLDEVEALLPLTREQAVERLLAGPPRRAVTPAPSWIHEDFPSRREVKGLDEAERRALRRKLRERALDLKAWWLHELLATEQPFVERMTLFWHNHFTSSLRKVKAPQLLYRQNLMLRSHALGNFRELVHAVARDPAMLVYLDNHTNRRGQPNENFARELLELFTLGEGHYSERDIKEAARAFTGWSVDRETGGFRYRRFLHDTGPKQFMGRRGRFDGDDVIELVLARPEVSEHLVEKLWLAFISDRPDAAEVRRLGLLWRRADYELKPLMRELLLSPHFWAPESRGVLVKSPVDVIVGTLRVFDLPVRDTGVLALASRRLGQDLFDPPNVKGWPGGKSWITATSLLERRALIERATRVVTSRRAPRGSGLGTDDPELLATLLLPLPPVDPVATDESTGRLIGQLLADPVYQLK